MKDCWKVLCERHESLIVYTVIDGDFSGEKMVWEGNKCIYADEFFKKHDLFCVAEKGDWKNGIVNINGVQIYRERFGKRPEIVICGSGNVGIALIKTASLLKIKTIVLEDREEFAEKAKEAGADEVMLGDYSSMLKKIKGTKDTAFIVVTRGHAYDKACLDEIFKKRYGYVGMMGSRRRVDAIKAFLMDSGVPKNRISDLHAPIGMDIAAETPEEIAISIMAEVIKEKNSKNRSEGLTNEMTEAIMNSESGDKIAIATIVSRNGSAPRSVGTKMLVYGNGPVKGTIGGGPMEARVIKKTMEMIAENESYMLIKEDITGEEALNDGMICGGTLQIFVERL